MMNLVSFPASAPVLLAAGFTGVLALALVMRRERALGWPGWRRWAWGLALLSLWWVFVRPNVRGPIRPERAVLLTEGAVPNDAERAVDEVKLGFAYGSAELGRSRAIPDAGYLARAHPEIDELEILGDGLDSWEIEKLPFPILRRNQEEVGPLLRARWQREVVLGHEFEVHLEWQGVESAQRIRLVGPSGDESIAELEDDAGAVALAALPKTEGRHLYHVEFVDSRETILMSEPLGVSVIAPPRRRILWLQDSPSFEARHVKHWLADSGTEITLRTRVSSDRFRTEFVNAAHSRLAALRRDVIGRFDLVVLDRRSLWALGASGRGELLSAVKDSGTGVLLLLPARDLAGLGAPFTALAVRGIEGVDELSVRPGWAGRALEPTLRIPAREILAVSGPQPVVWDAAGRVLAARVAHGRGSLGVSVLADTYRWRLQGEAPSFHALWSRLIEQHSRSVARASWRLPRGPILVDRPLVVELLVKHPDTGLPRVVLQDPSDSFEVAVLQDLTESDSWSLRLWPRQPGWHAIRTEPGSELWFHVGARDDWPAWVRSERRSATLAAAQSRTASAPEVERHWSPAPKAPAFAALLVALACLWLDERRRGRRRTPGSFSKPLDGSVPSS